MPSQRKVKSTPSWCSLGLLSLHSRSYSQGSPSDKDGDIAGSPLVPVQCNGRSADWPKLKHLDSGWGGDPRHLLRGSGQGERCLYNPSALSSLESFLTQPSLWKRFRCLRWMVFHPLCRRVSHHRNLQEVEWALFRNLILSLILF